MSKTISMSAEEVKVDVALCGCHVLHSEDVCWTDNMKRVTAIPVKLQQHVVIHFCQKLGITLTLTNVFLRQVFGGHTLHERSIRRWYKAFQNSCTCITDHPRANKICQGCSAGNIQAVKHLVEQDRRVSIRNISAETSLSYGTVSRILWKTWAWSGKQQN